MTLKVLLKIKTFAFPQCMSSPSVKHFYSELSKKNCGSNPSRRLFFQTSSIRNSFKSLKIKTTNGRFDV